jgi:hypothetical protein
MLGLLEALLQMIKLYKVIKLSDILKEIIEGKQVGTLYHYTNPKNIKSILNKGLKFSKPQEEISNNYYISTTRKKQKTWIRDAEIVLDGDAISNNYKIMPIQASTLIDNPGENWFKMMGVKIDSLGGSELAEERILSNSPGFLSPKYILKVNLPKK